MYKLSVICTVLNRMHDLERFTSSLINQKTDALYEIILIDNGSTDGTAEYLNSLASSHSNIQYIDAKKYYGSPYSARNMGIKAASGQIICFIDGYASDNWIDTISKINNDDHIIAGKIIIEITESSSIYELYDSIFNLDNEKIINKYHRAPTGNLVIPKKVFDELGYFNEKIRSGGDMIFTSLAYSHGYKIIYNKNQISYYYARKKEAILKKQVRISKGQINIWKSENKFIKYLLKSIIKTFIINNPVKVFSYIERRKTIKISFRKKVHLYLINEKMKYIMIFNNILESIKLLGK
ncbi:glycosyltransferase [Proteus vulgaris]|uniref:glycosyltransferase family 2 protein n=1 Tax=Proteus vulgaris TaxID=585 RepID=UPI0021B136BF|nr:glycosyltransferase [Proteus vulgaris]MCT6516278.1 glycosyltransferase [Proteus vulgaris]